MKTFYRRNLPHYHPPHATFFITFSLSGTLPKEVVARLMQERDEYERRLLKKFTPKQIKEKLHDSRKLYFGKFDALLDRAAGNRWLADERVADVIAKAIQFQDGKDYNLFSYCIMPNHVHLVISLIEGVRRTSVRPQIDTRRAEARLTSLAQVLRRLKGATAREANKILNRTGAFWHHERSCRTGRGRIGSYYSLCFKQSCESRIGEELA